VFVTVDFVGRIYQEQVSLHSGLMVKGMLSLLTICPHEVGIVYAVFLPELQMKFLFKAKRN
jgi:hypothetical protein